MSTNTASSDWECVLAHSRSDEALSADELLEGAGLDPAEVRGLLRATLREDLGERGDITSAATVPPGAELTVRWTARERGVLAGLPVLAALVEEHLGPDAGLDLLARDGDVVAAGQVVATLTAPAARVLEIERTSLNLLGHLSGVATLTRAWVDAVEGTGARIRDTRKTMPLLRSLQKYAVRCGGGVNHRTGLDDAVLVKDNHVAAAGGVGAALDAVAAAGLEPGTVVQVEVDDLDQLREALDHGATQVLLDNMPPAVLREAVALVRGRAPGVLLEASGGLTLGTAREVAETGVDFLAVGALTHSAAQLDLALDTTP
jgi:nicotinate-nucleotide pyrophosphorylase (carboxylating)